MKLNAKLVSALKYKGAVNTTALLPGSAENGDTYFVKADGFMYAYNSTSSAWDALGTVADMTSYFTKTEITAMLQDKADEFQYDALPTASSETVGVLLQYTGADTQDYKNGYFYKGIDNGDDTYGWELAKTGKYEDIIDDSTTSASTTWSSDKISGELSDALGDKVDYKLVVEDDTRYVEDIVTQDINTWLPNDNSSILVNLKKRAGSTYTNFQLLCNKQDSNNWSCIVSGGENTLWKIRYVNGVRYIDELATTNAVLSSLEVKNGNIATQIIPWADGTHYRGFEDKSNKTCTDIIAKDGVASIAKIVNGVLTNIEEVATESDLTASTDIALTTYTNSAFSILELKAVRLGLNTIQVAGILEIKNQCETLTFASGLPSPKVVTLSPHSMYIQAMCHRGTSSDASERVLIDKDGSMSVYTNTSGGNLYFSCEYTCI